MMLEFPWDYSALQMQCTVLNGPGSPSPVCVFSTVCSLFFSDSLVCMNNTTYITSIRVLQVLSFPRILQANLLISLKFKIN